MAGKKQFDEELALAIATELFRHTGFLGTSVDDLVEGMQLNRSSLYNAFGGKDALFIKVLERYGAWMMGVLVINHDLAPRDALYDFLERLVLDLEGWGRNGGCLVTNSMADFSQLPAAARDYLQYAVDTQEAQFADYLRVARERGELSSGADIKALASFFMSVRQSLGLLWKTGCDRDKLMAVVATAVASLPVAGATAAAS